MGYTLTIGNAVPKFDKDDFPHLSAKWAVELAASEAAPVFQNDGMTLNTNQRSPGYTVWHELCRQTQLDALFLGPEGLLGAHPGCAGLTREAGEMISAARRSWEAAATLPPGFEGWEYKGPARYDYTLARLIWLDFWVDWALTNCETPAIANT